MLCRGYVALSPVVVCKKIWHRYDFWLVDENFIGCMSCATDSPPFQEDIFNALRLHASLIQHTRGECCARYKVYCVLEVPSATAIRSPVTSAVGIEKYIVVFMSTTFTTLLLNLYATSNATK